MTPIQNTTAATEILNKLTLEKKIYVPKTHKIVHVHHSYFTFLHAEFSKYEFVWMHLYTVIRQ